MAQRKQNSEVEGGSSLPAKKQYRKIMDRENLEDNLNINIKCKDGAWCDYIKALNHFLHIALTYVKL